MSSRQTAAESPTITQLERRTFVRLASDLQATCRAAGALRDAGWPGTVCDISRGGIGLALTHRFQPGTELAIELRDEKGDLRRILCARVVHTAAAFVGGHSCWRLGCEFDSPLSEEEFEAMR
jgi:hypothetical protein